MYICVCNAIPESKLRNIIKCNKIKSLKDFHNLQICPSGCKKCYKDVQELIKVSNE